MPRFQPTFRRDCGASGTWERNLRLSARVRAGSLWPRAQMLRRDF
jgi:hypothetical protein